jgi:rRNA maturation RNase YbeY
MLLDHLGRGDSELSILFTDDLGISILNERYLNRSGTTNVISFGAGESFSPGPDILGDVAVNTDAAQRQARVRGVGINDEIMILIVHGLLHLLGHVHDPDEGASPKDAMVMEGEERKLLSVIGIDIDL